MSIVEKDDQLNKPLFVTRSIAFMIDAFLVMLISTIISSPFVNSDKITTFAQESQVLLEKYSNKEITEQEYVVDVSNLEYQIATSTELITLMGVFIGLIYYAIIPLYNNGQTLGKKLMKLKIVSTYGDLNSNQLVFRCFIANSILLNLLSVLFVMFASRDAYMTCVELFTFAQYTITAVSIFMVVINKNGLSLHDEIVHTKVVKVN